MTHSEKTYNQDYRFDDDYVPLKIRAEDKEDLHIVSALLQDSIVPSKSLKHDAKNKTFSLLANRFRWEASAKDDALEQNERVFSSLYIENVEAIHKKNFSESKGEAHHALLCILQEGPHLTFLFSGEEEIILTLSSLKLRVRDISEPWPTEICPIHHHKENHSV